MRAVEIAPHPFRTLRGIRSPGTGIPGVIAYGVRRSRGGRDFTAVVSGLPAVRVDLEDSAPFARLVVSVRNAEATAAAVRGTAGI